VSAGTRSRSRQREEATRVDFLNGDNLLAVIPGGSSMPLVPAAQCVPLPMDFDGTKDVKS
jgi:NADH:ubiquinone oxidoreductase subunit F (NADH-binding)